MVLGEIYTINIGSLVGWDDEDGRVAVDYIIASALEQEVSDIHIQFQEYDLIIRFRVHGVLTLFSYFTIAQGVRIVARLKVLMGLDMTQVYKPQDGGFRVSFGQRIVDIRASFFPSLYGEKVVIRLLHATYRFLELHSLPFGGDIVRALYEIVRHDQGLFLVTGPTGAGKTTTLYALLQAIDRDTRNIVTLENPIEYRIAGVTQTQIDISHTVTFAQGVRSLLRQDPDVALIGELRDADTVHSAIEAALTGHLVFSSLHTGSASGVPIRLREMGIEPYLIASSLKGVLAQRLIHVLCYECKVMMPISEEQKAWLALQQVVLEYSYVAGGCTACRYTGVAGQRVIAELWRCSPAALAQLLQDPTTTQADFERIARLDGMIPLVVCGIELVKQQEVSLAELIDRDV